MIEVVAGCPLNNAENLASHWYYLVIFGGFKYEDRLVTSDKLENPAQSVLKFSVKSSRSRLFCMQSPVIF